MNLHGVDVFICSPQMPDVPQEIGSLKLTLISNRGTRIYPPPAPDMPLLDVSRCRYLSDAEISDAQIDAALAHLTSLGRRWAKCQKLYRKDGVDQFSQAY